MVASEIGAQPESSQPASIWDELRGVVDVVAYRPTLRDGLVWRQLATVHGEEYVIVQNPQAATYLRLSPEDFYVFELMDGSQSVQDLVVAYMLKFRKFALARVVRLVGELRYQQFLVDRPYFTFQQLRRKARRRTVGTVLDDYLTVVFNREFPISGIDGILERIYSAGIWVLFTRPVLWFLAVLSAIGVPLFIYYVLSRHFSLFPGDSIGQDLVGYYVSFLIIAVSHELSHAFMVKSCGRVVRRGGFSIFYGFPGLFVDTQDIWMEPRRQRMAASWAGPYSGLIYAGLVGILLTIWPESAWSAPLRLFGSVALVANMFQLMPLIQLDGYFILMDWLEMPSLRKRALAFVRHDLWAKIWRRQRLNREERIFTIFGVLAAVYTVYAIFFAASFWWNQASDAIQGALLVPNLGSLIGLALILLLIVPFGLAVLRRVLDLGQSVLLLARHTGGAARERWHRQQVALLSQVPTLAGLSAEQTQVLAHHMRQEQFSPGVAVVRQRDRSDRFYIIAEGQAEVAIERDDRSEVVANLGPADYFGERALLNNTPRTATVRASTRLRVFSIGAKDFHRTLAPYLGADAALRPRLEERNELDEFPLFEPLGAREKDLLLTRMWTETYQPGEMVVREGDSEGGFYCIRSGHVEVMRHSDAVGRPIPVATLGPKDFFGEVSLLLQRPRNATVRAVEEVRLWVISRADFRDLLAHYFEMDVTLADAVRARLPSRIVLFDPSRRLPSGEVREPAFAPDFRLESVQGTTHTLSEFRGSNVVLWMSRGLADPGCSEFAARLDAAAPLFQAAGIQLAQVIPDTIGQARAAWGQGQMKHLVLCDPEKSAYLGFDLCAPGAQPAATPAPNADPDAGSWLARLGDVSRDDALQSKMGLVMEGLILVDRSGAIRATRLTATAGPLPEPEELLRRLTRSLARDSAGKNQ